MTEHIPVPYGYFKSQESRFFQAEKWAITGPDHDHEESWDIVADGIPDETTARFIVTACNCHSESQKALRELLKWAYWATSQIDSKGPWSEILEAEKAIRKAEK